MAFVLQFIDLAFTLLNLAILGRILLSWINISPYHPIAQALVRITEPILGPIRRIVPPVAMFDLTPMIALIALSIIERIIFSMLGARF